MNPEVGIVVPTLGQRLEYLKDCLGSIRAAGKAHILLVCPGALDVSGLRLEGLIDSVIEDPGTGLPQAINAGIRALPENVDFVNWLGDDDLLHSGSITCASEILKADPQVTLVFGSCNYIDAHGEVIWTNISGQWAVPLMRFGPDLIPQPGALFRRDVFENTGELNPTYRWAFDFDLFVRFAKNGRLKFVKQTLSSFRWHPDSLTVEFRGQSAAEASRVRTSHLPRLLKPFSQIWEYPIRQATILAGKTLSSRASNRAGSR